MNPRFAAMLGIALLSACGKQAPTADTAATAPPPAPAPAAAAPAMEPATEAPADDEGFAPLDERIVASTDTLASVQARLGGANAVAGKVPGAEGEEFDGWLLYPDDPKRRAYVYLDEGTGHPTMVSVLDGESTWGRVDGVRMGMDLAELARRNGAPVKFHGFEWDYGGYVVGWNGGAFDRQPPLGGVRLCPPELEPGTYPDDYPVGEGEFDSDGARVREYPPIVCEFSVTLEAPTP